MTIFVKLYVLSLGYEASYTRKNLTTCSKSANKPSTIVFARLVTSCQQV